MNSEEYQDRIEELIDLGYSKRDAILSILAELEWERNARIFGVL